MSNFEAYDEQDKSQFAASIPVNDEDEEAAASAHVQSLMPKAGARMSFTAPQSLIAENEKEGEMVDPMEAHRASRVSDREDEYKARRRARIISPERHDPFAAGDQTPAAGVRTYGDIMAEQQLVKEKEAVMRQVAKKMEEEKEEKKRSAGGEAGAERKKRRWDSAPGTGATAASAATTAAMGGATPMLGGTTPMMGGETPVRMDGGATPLVGSSAWDAPDTTGGATPSRWDAPTPSIGQSRRNRWDETPVAGETPARLDPGATPMAGVGATPVVGEKKVRSRWDETPVAQTPGGGG